MTEFVMAIVPRLANSELERGGGPMMKRRALLGALCVPIFRGSHGGGVQGRETRVTSILPFKVPLMRLSHSP